jgi:hypothetical protein
MADINASILAYPLFKSDRDTNTSNAAAATAETEV